MQRIWFIISLIVVYVSGAVVLADFFSKGLFDNAGALLSLWVSIITAFAFLLGLLNVLRVHLEKIRRAESEQSYSFILLLSALAVVLASVYGRLTGMGDTVTNWLFQYLYQPLTTAFFSLLAFLMITTAVRVLRIGTVESSLLLAGALIVLLGQVAISPLNNFAAVSQWFQDYPVQGAIRGILIGAALGAVATSLRYLLGIDNQYLR